MVKHPFGAKSCNDFCGHDICCWCGKKRYNQILNEKDVIIRLPNEEL